MIFARRQASAVEDAGLRVVKFFLESRTSLPKLFAEFRRFRRTIAAARADVVHAHFGTMTALFAALACARTPLVVTYRGSDLNPTPGGGWRARAGRLLSQLAALRASAIVCVSEQLRQRLWWARDRVTVLPSGVDPRVFAPRPREAARAILQWPQDARIVLFNAGHDPRNKRLDLARAAFEIAAREVPHLRMELLEGTTNPDCIPLLMNGADCLLVTSDAEGSPTVVQEALASNLPIVSVPVGDIPERLAGVDHCKIAARDPHALARAIADVVRIPQRSNGRDAIDSISAPAIAARLCHLYRECRS
jgi:glycosyltransferase involved in cell wall biosynthesis